MKSIMYKVMCPVQKDERTIWLRMGTGFENSDGSKTLYLDAFPQNGKLWMREMDDTDFKSTSSRAAAGSPVNTNGTAGDLPF